MFAMEIAEMIIAKNGLIGHFTESSSNVIDAVGKFTIFTYFVMNLSGYSD